MALFGKKEPEGKAPGVQAPAANKIVPREQKKNLPKGKESLKANKASRQTTYLGKNLKINGNISGEGSLIILGQFEGEFDINGELKIAQGAVIKGDIKATGVSINGIVNGSVEAKERILLDTTASMKGRLVTPKISIQDGAVFDGELQMSRKQEPAPKTVTPETKQPHKAAAVSEIK
jgi:cytoskeletal protein CcmA (bactofilin family)